MEPFPKIVLGNTGIQVSRMAIGSSYGIDPESLQEALERGINFFYFGTLRTKKMAQAVHRLAPNHRNQMLIAVQSYARWPAVLSRSVNIALRKLKLEYADFLILGKVDSPLSEPMAEEALRLKESGKIRFLIVSSHKRKMFSSHVQTGMFDAIMVRYNAAHTGAESDVFPLLPVDSKPGIICYTATRWGMLLRPVPGERTPSAADCYRFVLSHPAVDVCMCGPKNRSELEQAFRALESPPMADEELEWMRRVGKVVYHRQHHNFLLRKLIFD